MATSSFSKAPAPGAAGQDHGPCLTGYPFREWLDPDSLRHAEGFSAGDYLRSRAVPDPVVTTGAKVVIWTVFAATVAYCVAIWVGVA